MTEKTRQVDGRLSDPSEFSGLIAEQKKRCRQRPDNVEEWLALGRLYEARIDCIKRIAQRSLVVRHGTVMSLLIFFSLMALIVHVGLEQLITRHPLVISVAGMAITTIYLFILKTRYPRSGRRFFEKAIMLDEKAGDAYLFLGLIALRRFQKRKACWYLEQAGLLNVDDKRISQELKTIYEKEFVAFFSSFKRGDCMKEKTIEWQQQQLEKMKSSNFILKTNNSVLTAKIKQVRSSASRSIKEKSEASARRLAAQKAEYDMQIADLRSQNQELIQNHDQPVPLYINLSDGLLKRNPNLEELSFENGNEPVEFSLDLELWRSLSKRTRLYLMTAAQTYQMFSQCSGNKDFSLIGLEWCKALELEINLRLVSPFLDYIKERKEAFLQLNTTGIKKNKPTYFSYLPMVVDELNYPHITSLTLGQFYFVLKRSLRNEFSLNDYTAFLKRMLHPVDQNSLQHFVKTLGTVTHKYRNVIAHGSPLSVEQCNSLRQLLFTGDNALIQILSNTSISPEKIKPRAVNSTQPEAPAALYP